MANETTVRWGYAYDGDLREGKWFLSEVDDGNPQLLGRVHFDSHVDAELVVAALNRETTNWEGVTGEHRTVGPHRAWCLVDAEWCYPDPQMHCAHCARETTNDAAQPDPARGECQHRILPDVTIGISYKCQGCGEHLVVTTDDYLNALEARVQRLGAGLERIARAAYPDTSLLRLVTIARDTLRRAEGGEGA